MPSAEYLGMLVETTRQLSKEQLYNMSWFIGINPDDKGLVTDLDFVERLESARQNRANLLDEGLWNQTLNAVSGYLVEAGVVAPEYSDVFTSSVNRGFNTLDRAEEGPSHNAGYRGGPCGPIATGPGYLQRTYNAASKAGLANDNVPQEVRNWFESCGSV